MRPRNHIVNCATLVLLFFIIMCTSSMPLSETAGGSTEFLKAEEIFHQDKYEEALSMYEKIHAAETGQETKYRALYREIECLSYLFRYGDAAQRLLYLELPSDTRIRAWVLILKAAVLQDFLAQYSSVMRADVIEGAPDVFNLTPAEIRKHIMDTYVALWQEREALLAISLKDQQFFVELDKINFANLPSLCDFFVLSFSEYLYDEEDKTISLDQVQGICSDAFRREVDFADSPLLLAASLMEWQGNAHRSGQGQAGEYWQIQRLLSPFRHLPPRFYGQFKALKAQTKDVLLAWMQNFSHNESKAEAGCEAAQILNEEQNYIRAVELCREIEKQYLGTEGASLAGSLRLKIELPYLTLQAQNMLPARPKSFTLYARNIPAVYFRLYRPELKSLFSNYESAIRWSQLVRNPDEEWVSKEVLRGKKPVVAWKTELADTETHKMITQQAALPEIKPGVYVLLASNMENFSRGSALIVACVVNVTDIMLIGSTGRSTATLAAFNRYLLENGSEKIDDQLACLYTLNAYNGEPVEGAEVAWHYSYNVYGQKGSTVRITSGKDGSAALVVPINFNGRSEWGYLYPVVKKRDSYAYWNNQAYFDSTLPSPIELFIQTDRPIYRPGQAVMAKVVAVKRTAQGFRTLDGSYTVNIMARDANGKVFLEKDLVLNDFGSADLSFTIPQGRLLGRYTLEARCSKDRLDGSCAVPFNVEEYKRPEFEVNIGQDDEGWLYNREVKIKGKVRYYFGGDVANALVTYRIKRQSYLPWYYRYWYADYAANQEQEVAWGQVRADEKGDFVFSFIPSKNENSYSFYLQGKLPDISLFNVYVEARDEGGRTISSSSVYKASDCGFYLKVEAEKGFFNDDENIGLKACKLTVNDTPLSGAGSFELYRLKDEPLQTYAEIGKNYHTYDGSFTRVPPLDVELAQVPVDFLAAKGQVTFSASGEQILQLAPLAKGIYRLYLHAGDKNREMVQEAIVVVIPRVSEDLGLNATSLLLADKSEYQVGDQAQFVLGSGCSAGNYFLELYQGRFLLRREYLKAAPGAARYQLKIIDEMKGGFTLRWFSVTDMQVFHGEAFIPVSETDKKLDLSFNSWSNVLTPGDKAAWGITVRDYQGRPANAEVLALMYDRALEYYSRGESPWLAGLYGRAADPPAAMGAIFLCYGVQFRITYGVLFQLQAEAEKDAWLYQLPYLRIRRAWAPGYDYDFKAGLAFGRVSKSRGRSDESADLLLAKGELRGTSISMEEGVKDNTPRKNFSETAFFLPYVRTDAKGQASFSFSVPEQLTAWRVKLFAFTNEAAEGVLVADAVTKKDLMVRIDIPRYFREKDEGSITVFVHNESDKTLKGKLVVAVSAEGEVIHRKIKLTGTEKSFAILPHKAQSFSWPVSIPEGVGLYTVKAEASAAGLSDAEQRELPILPSRERLVESICTSLSGNEKKTLRFVLEPDPTRINESMQLQIDPQLALSLLNTIPFLMQYPYECVEQLLNKYVPLAIMQKIYDKYPSLKKAVAKIPQRHTVTPEWEQDDPRRQMTAMETPWVWQAEGRPSPFPLIDLLDPDTVAGQKDYVLERLKQAQLADGSFPWWPGGPSDLYMTLYVLAGFAEARAYGVEVPADMVNRALGYVAAAIPAILKEEQGSLALIAYATYVLSSYPGNEFYEAKKGRELLPSWIRYLDEHRQALTPLGKAYLALGLFRTGNKERANQILDVIMDSAREDELAGVYWTPEKYSWVWYSDTVEKHAFMIRVLAEMRPDDGRLAGLVQWLLFNRKGNVWKSTKASVQAVYSLLDFLKTRGALDSDETFQVSWGGVNEKITLQADEWLEKPIRYFRSGPEITPQTQEAVIEKQGKGLAFASMVWVYSTDRLPEASVPGLLEVQRTFYRRVKQGETYHLKPLATGDRVAVGEQIEVQIKINARSQFEYLHLKDPKAAGFEAETLTSGWKYDPLWYYEEPRDSLTNFFFSRLPHGEYILRYRLRPTKAGKYRIGAAVLQSMYAPEMTAHSDGFMIVVE